MIVGWIWARSLGGGRSWRGGFVGLIGGDSFWGVLGGDWFWGGWRVRIALVSIYLPFFFFWRGGFGLGYTYLTIYHLSMIK